MRNQSGCRFMQKKLDEQPNLSHSVILPLILNGIVELSMDPFGNYFIQKFINCLPLYDLIIIFTSYFSNNFLKLSFSSHGTRVIQAFLARTYQDKYIMSLFDTVYYYTQTSWIIGGCISLVLELIISMLFCVVLALLRELLYHQNQSIFII